MPLQEHAKGTSQRKHNLQNICLLYTSDAADDTPCVDLGGRRIIKKKKQTKIHDISKSQRQTTNPQQHMTLN
ncbi:hypothetical protein AMBR_DPAELIID_02779 [Lacticaseibacillus rhamnosus]|nr:hypothetical protein AMBR_DPAELIID_02779 [Lacticaseibacillus rhamnosus]